jgi:bifunctional oligoribonuclease and PAP phosphatase NrnA
MDPLSQIRDAVLSRSTFLVTSHARPDGDSIGSQVAFAAALRALGKQVRLVNRDAPPPPYLALPGVDGIEVTERVDAARADALVVMECGDLARPGIAGLEGRFIINIDHHVGNTMYGAINWFDESAAACGEMVADVIDTLGVPWSREIATSLYLAILTDTGSFRYGNITARTFAACRRAVDAGVDAAAVARRVYDNNGIGKLRLIGALLGGMQLVADGRAAILTMDDRLVQATGAEPHDTDGLINMPLMAAAIEAVALVRHEADQDQVRVSLRSKGPLNVRAIAAAFGGGGHVNASGFTVQGDPVRVQEQVILALEQGIKGTGQLGMEESAESKIKESREREIKESKESKERQIKESKESRE